MTHFRPQAISTEELWRGLRERLVDFTERRTRSREDAEDVVQDVFLGIHRALDTGTSLERPDAFLFRTARNAIVDRYRRAGVRELEVPAEPEGDEDPGEEVREALAACLGRFVDQLPEPYAEAVRWVDLEGLTQTEAAARAGISVSGMKSRVQRGRAQLRGLFDACCRFELDVRGSVIGYERRPACCSSE